MMISCFKHNARLSFIEIKFIIFFKISNIITSTLKLQYSNGEIIEVPQPDAGQYKFNFFNRICLRYQAEECRMAISKGTLLYNYCMKRKF